MIPLDKEISHVSLIAQNFLFILNLNLDQRTPITTGMHRDSRACLYYVAHQIIHKIIYMKSFHKHFRSIHTTTILAPLQWGSEIRPFEIPKHSKSGLFEGRISNGLYVVGFQMVPTIRKPEKMADLVKTVVYKNNFLFIIINSLD